MKKFWKILAIALMATYFVFFITGFSMFWWPNIPSSPRPSEGRIYPLNNHGHYTYMNEREHCIRVIAWGGGAVVFFALLAIQVFIDPVDYKAKRRKYGSPPPEFR